MNRIASVYLRGGCVRDGEGVVGCLGSGCNIQFDHFIRLARCRDEFESEYLSVSIAYPRFLPSNSTRGHTFYHLRGLQNTIRRDLEFEVDYLVEKSVYLSRGVSRVRRFFISG